MKQLEENYHVKIVKKRPMIIALTPKEKSKQQKADDEFLKIIGCEIGDKNIELLKFILKSILEKEIVPTREEFANRAWHEETTESIVSKGTITNYMNLLKDNNIIVEPSETPVMEVDKETGEIEEYNVKHVNWIYYDYGKDGIVANRERLSEDFQKMFHAVYGREFAEAKKSQLKSMLKQGYSKADAISILQRKVIRELGTHYEIVACERVAEPIINFAIAGKLKKYFGLNEQRKEITPDFSNVEVVDIERPIGQAPSEIESYVGYRQLMRQRADLYKKGKDAFSLSLYNKLHGEETFAHFLKSKTLGMAIDFSKSFEKHKELNEIALMKNEVMPENIIVEEITGFPEAPKKKKQMKSEFNGIQLTENMTNAIAEIIKTDAEIWEVFDICDKYELDSVEADLVTMLYEQSKTNNHSSINISDYMNTY
ncbi:MAG: hypothetical protein WAM95_06090 [Bacillus sp. (in: firmicutes)]